MLLPDGQALLAEASKEVELEEAGREIVGLQIGDKVSVRIGKRDHHEGADLPTWEEGGLRGRLIAGEIDGMKSAVRVLSPQFYMHWEMDAGATTVLPGRYSERAVYVSAGSAEVGGLVLGDGQMAVLKPGKDVPVTAKEKATLMVLGGEPIGERFLLWNFVSSSKARLEQAKEDWKQGRMKLPDGDDQEFMPFPDRSG